MPLLGNQYRFTKKEVKAKVSEFFHCVKSVRIRSFSDPFFPAFRQNIEGYGVFLRVQYPCGTIQTRKTPNRDTFHAVFKSAEVCLGPCKIFTMEYVCNFLLILNTEI